MNELQISRVKLMLMNAMMMTLKTVFFNIKSAHKNLTKIAHKKQQDLAASLNILSYLAGSNWKAKEWN